MTETFDIIIVGGGPVGSACALALARSGLRIAVLEARKPVPTSGDGRTLALSYGSHLILERIGAWDEALQPTPITTVHVSQRGGFGRTLLRASELALPALGYTISYNSLRNCLSECLGHTDIKYVWEATVSTVTGDAQGALVDAHIGGAAQQLRARLAVLADGAGGLNSAQGATREKDYGQVALTALVRSTLAHNGCAYERFTPEGPVALLPVRDRFALVWVTQQARSEELLRTIDADFIMQLQQHFGERQGRFIEVGTRAAFPLRLRYAREVAAPGVVRVGNAAQAVHPVAAQGFNLGLRDAWSLSQLINQSGAHELNGATLARDYTRARRFDRRIGIGVTDLLTQVFEIDQPLARAARGAGLWLLESAGPLRRAFTRAMLFGNSR